MKKLLSFSLSVFGILFTVSGAKADSCSSPTNLVVNCGFETGDFSGWSVSPPGYDGVWYGVDHFDAFSGSYGAYLGGFGSYSAGDSNFALVSQSLPTTVGTLYSLSFEVAHFALDTPPAPPDDAFLFGVNTTLLGLAVNVGNQGWANYTYSFTADSPTTLLQFYAEDANYFFSLDDVSVGLAPEPASLLLIVPALAGLYLLCRRKAILR